jgi:hypothetical protein
VLRVKGVKTFDPPYTHSMYPRDDKKIKNSSGFQLLDCQNQLFKTILVRPILCNSEAVKITKKVPKLMYRNLAYLVTVSFSLSSHFFEKYV